MKDLKDKLKNVPNQKPSGAQKDLRTMSTEDLMKMAKQKNIPVPMGSNRDVLIKALEGVK